MMIKGMPPTRLNIFYLFLFSLLTNTNFLHSTVDDYLTAFNSSYKNVPANKQDYILMRSKEGVESEGAKLQQQLLSILKTINEKEKGLFVDSDLVGVNYPLILKEWAVKIIGGFESVEKVLEETKLTYVRKMKGFVDVYVLRESPKLTRNIRNKRNIQRRLESDSNVKFIELQKPLNRHKRSLSGDDISITNILNSLDQENEIITNGTLFNDPLWKDQWQIHQNDELKLNTSIQLYYDMGIMEAWRSGFTGKGVTISILDDGIDYNHEDLKQNFAPEVSYDFNDDDKDPLCRMDDFNKHGTKCAGIVGMVANNTKCGVGIAFNAKIGAIRMLDGEVNDRIESESITFANQIVDIYIAAWGPADSSRIVDGPKFLTSLAFKSGVQNGRNQKGSIFVWASGNGGLHLDDCAVDGYSSSIYTISVSSVSQNNQFPWYGEECPSTLVSAYSSGSKTDNFITTTSTGNECSSDFSGSSASAPTVGGVIALALEANPSLTWRDIQHMIVMTAEPSGLIQTNEEGWKMNGAGFMCSNKFGFGLINAQKMIKHAQKWVSVPEMTSCSIHFPNFQKKKFNAQKGIHIEFKVDGCKGKQNEVNYVEQIQLVVEAQSVYRGNLALYLHSPSGVTTQLLHPRPLDDSNEGFNNWPFTSVHNWGEKSVGDWSATIVVIKTEAFISNMTFVIYGTKHKPMYRKVKKQYTIANIERFLPDASKAIKEPSNTSKFAKRYIQKIREKDVSGNYAEEIEKLIALQKEIKSMPWVKKSFDKVSINTIEK